MANHISFSRTLENPVAEKAIQEAVEPHLLPPLARIVAKYVTDEKPFGPEQWSAYFRSVSIEDPVLPLPEKFYTWWNGPDYIDPSKRVYETHLPPVYRPQFIRYYGRITPYDIGALNFLIKASLKGHKCPPILFYPYDAQFGNLLREAASPGRWLVARKGVVARNETVESQSKNHDLPSAIDLATIALAHYTVTGECYLGTAQGMEKQETLSRCRERGMIGNRTVNVCVGQFSPVSYPKKGNKLYEQRLDTMLPGLLTRLFDCERGLFGLRDAASPSIGVALVHEFDS